MAQNTELFKPIKEGPGTLVGSYKLLQQIGEGGFGVVYMAEQQQPVRRLVALKIIKPGMDSKEVVARFEAERQALALMEHPNIARVLDAGTTDSGRPYFVMELVKGVLLTEYCDKNHLSTEKRLNLFVTVCHAVQHAHQKGVIHRDIKPSNVMVTLHDGHPVPKVIDFGVAKATNQRLTERTLFTAYGQMIGTPAYMSPEQAEMSGLDIDTRSDIYSLGVLLYELLTGSTPFDSRRLRDAGYLEMQRIIREEEPPRPSTRVSTLGEALTALSNQRSVDPKQFAETLRGDIDLIVMKALEKERNRRYDTPNSFAADIERYLHHEPVEARAPSALYRMRKFAQRNKTAVVTGGLVAGALVLATFVSSSLAIVANRESQRAVAAKRDADANFQQAIESSQRAQESEAKAIAAASAEREAKEAESRLRASAEQRRLDIERQNAEIEALNSTLRKQKEEQRRIAYVGQMLLIQKAWDSNNFDRVRELLNATRPGLGETDLRGLEWHYWRRKIHPTENAIPLPKALAESQRRFSADGRWLACVPRYSGENAKVFIVDVTNGAIAFETTIALGPKPPVEELADGNTEWSQSVQVAHVDDIHVAIAVSNYQTKLGRDVSEENLGGPTILKIMRRDTKDTHFEANARSNYGFCQFVFSRDGNRVAAPLEEPLVKVWDVNTGAELHSIPIPTDASTPRYAERLALNHDGTQVAIKPLRRLSQGVHPFGITLVELSTGSSVVTPSVSVSNMSYNIDSTRLFAFGSSISVFEPASGKKLASFDRGDDDQRPRDVSPDGKWLVVEKGQLTFDPRVKLPVHWLEIVDSSTGRVEATFKGFSGWVNELAFSSDGRSLVTALDHGIVTWPLPTSPIDTPVDEDTRFIVSPDGRWRVSVSPNVSSESRATETDTNQSPRTIQLTDIKGQVENRDLPIQESLGVSLSAHFKFAPDGSFFAAVSTDPRGNLEQAGELNIWDTDSGREILSQRMSVHAIRRNDETTLVQNFLAYRHVAFASGNRRVAVALPIDGSINAKSMESLRRISDSLSGFVPDKSKLHVWDVISGGGLRPLDVSIEMPFGSRVEFNQNGNGLLILPPVSATLAKNSPIECYDAQTGQRLWRHDIFPLGLALTQDHAMIVSVVEEQGAVNLIGWHSNDGRMAFRLPWSPEKKLSNAIQSDDRHSVAILTGQDVHVIDVTSSNQRLVLAQSGGDVLDFAFSKDSKRIITSFGSTALRRVGTFESARRRDLWPKGIAIWDSQTGQELLTLSTPARGQPIWDYSYPIELDEQSIAIGNEVVFDIAPLKNKTLVRELTLATRDILFATTSSIVDDKRGLQFIQEAYNLEPSNVEVASLWALAHFRSEGARSAMQGILSKDGLDSKPDYPKSSEAYTLRALSMHYQGNRDKAMELLKQAQITTSLDENFWLRLVREVRREMAIPLASLQPDQWIGHQFMPRQFKYDLLLPMVATKTEGDRLQFGDVFLDSVEVVRLEDAVAFYTAGLETHSRESKWRHYRGATRSTLGDFDLAIEDYTRAIELDQDPAAFINRGNLLAKEKGQFEPAIADFKRALGIRSSDARAHASLARTYREMGKLGEALESANEAIRFEASNGSHYCNRAYIHAANGKLDAMRADFEKAIALCPEDRRVWQQRAWLLATDDQHRNGPQAVLDATKACELSYWLVAESLDHLAAAYAETGDFAQAIQWQEKAIALSPVAKRPKLDARLQLYKQHKPFREPLIRVQAAK